MSRSLNLTTLLWIAPLFLGLGILSGGFFSQAPTEEIPEEPTSPRNTPASVLQTSPHFRKLDLIELQSPEDCRTEIKRLKDSPDLHPMIRGALHDRALRAWLRIDSASAFAYAESEIGNYGSRDNEGIRLFRVWFDLDPESAFEAQKIASPALAKVVHPYLFRYLASVDPQRTLTLLKDIKIEDSKKIFWGRAESEAYRHWVQDNPEEALRHFLGKKQLNLSGFLTATNLLGDWSSNDPEAAWDFYQKNKDHRHFRSSASSILVMNLLQKDPTRLKDIDTESATFLTQKWAQTNLQSAIDFANTLSKDDPWYHHFSVSIASNLASSKPETAIEMALAAHNGPEAFSSRFGLRYGNTHEILFSAFSSIQSTNPERAMDLLKSIPETLHTRALAGILSHEFKTDPDNVLQTALQLRDDPRIPLSLHIPIASLFGESGSSQLDIAPFIQHFPELRDSIKQNPLIFNNWITSSPETAATYFAEEISNTPELSSNEVRNFSRSLSELTISRPEFTSQWIHELPPGELQNNVAETLAANWIKYDPAATREWIQQLAEGELKETAQKAIDQ